MNYYGVWADPKAAEAKYLAHYGEADSQKSTKQGGSGKASRRKRPEKPRKDFPLYAHVSGQWAATIRGRDYYFGVWANPDTALDRYLKEKDYLEAGIAPPDRA